MSKYDLAVVIGRFQPFHNGHENLIESAFDKAKRVLILVGSANSPIGYKNPWTFEQRKDMIKTTMSMKNNFPYIKPLPDVWNNDEKWVSNIHSLISEVSSNPSDVCLVGYEKDASSYYLKLFPEYDFVGVDHYGTLSSTDIREDYFKKAPHLPHGLVSDSVWDYLKEYYNTDSFRYILEEYEGKRKYDKLWENSPYPPHFVTADNVVTHNGKILLIKRGGWPGKGLLALPGGFIDPHKGDSFENAVHELYEETKLADSMGQIPIGKLRGYYENREGKRFDNPSRSIRGYTLTTAFRVKLESNKKYKVKGSDDAVHADWYNFNDIKEEMMFEDHYHIIQEML